MRSTAISLLMLIGMTQMVVAQSALPKATMDSLWVVWNNPKEADTNRLKAIQKIAWNGYLRTRPDSAYYFAQWLFDFAKAKGHRKWMAAALNTQGVSFYYRGDHAKALLVEVLDAVETLHDLKIGIE